MDKRAWQMKQQQFDPKILQEIRMFRVEDLNDNVLRENWLEVAKRFAKMKLTQSVVEEMTYEEFATLRCIMSATLGDLSKKTQSQRDLINTQQQSYSALKHEQQMLTQIYNDNLQKSKKIRQKIQRLKKQEEEDILFGDFLDSHDNSKIH